MGVRVRVEQTPLPGIGVRHDLITSSGRTVGVVSHRSGRRDLVLYDVDDPDACLASIPLTDDEAEALADVLGASLMLGQLAGLRQQAAGLVTERPAIRTSPDEGLSNPAMMRSRVVLPQPLGPRNEMNSPRATDNDTPRSAGRLP